MDLKENPMNEMVDFIHGSYLSGMGRPYPMDGVLLSLQRIARPFLHHGFYLLGGAKIEWNTERIPSM